MLALEGGRPPGGREAAGPPAGPCPGTAGPLAAAALGRPPRRAGRLKTSGWPGPAAPAAQISKNGSRSPGGGTRRCI